MIGRILGSYRIVEQIGLGGMATVYKAYDAATDRYVAVKILPEHYSKDPTFRQRFEREAKAIARMEHIHILPIFTYGDEDGTAYLVMRYMQAGTLAELIGQGPLPVGEASRLLTQVASALDYAHRNGILHRDVKPSNVLVDAEGNAFLTDFGIAKMVEGTSDLTGSGLIGTPHYMSPEQCQGAKKLTAASDQYSLGVVLYEMLTGSKPYQAETPVAVILMQMNGPLPSPRSQRPDITDDMEAVIYKALAKQPEMRYPSCCAMAEAFARAAQTAESQAATVPSQPKPGESPITSAIPGLEPDEGTVRVAPPAPAPPRRKIPGWAIGLIGVIVVGGGILAAVLSGAFSGLPGGGSLAITPTAAASPAPSSPVLALKGVKHVFVCEGPNPRQELCFERAGSGDKPIRVKTDMWLDTVNWSPDGTQLAVTAREADAPEASPTNAYVMNIADGNMRLIDDKHYNLWAIWSPNGSWLAMHSDGALVVVRPEGTDFRQLWMEPYECIITPQWSPDSQRIVFTLFRCAQPAPRRRIFVVTLDGIATPIVEMTMPPACGDPRVAFSQDGEFIVYLDEDCHAKLIGADGSPTTKTTGDFNMMWTGEFFPQWGPVE